MQWHEVMIKTTEEGYDAICEMLTVIGAGGVSIDDPNEIRREISKADSLDYADDEFINSLGEDVIIKAYFPGENNIVELIDLIKVKINFIKNFLDTGEGYMGYTDVDDEDWATSWKKYYKPIHITEKIVIKPSWEAYEAISGEIVIEMDPGMAFGTGTHETTKMCAQLIENLVKKGDTVIDVGCGTGILSIIAAKLGAGKITAIDIDGIAVRVTKENCELNNVSETVIPVMGILKDVTPKKADIIVANIIANVIIDISDLIPYYLKADGFFATSGIIKERKQEVIEAYLKNGFTCENIIELGEWVAILFKCQNSL
jgi:ribosomal protein L11 methyltransferase